MIFQMKEFNVLSCMVGCHVQIDIALPDYFSRSRFGSLNLKTELYFDFSAPPIFNLTTNFSLHDIFIIVGIESSMILR